MTTTDTHPVRTGSPGKPSHDEWSIDRLDLDAYLARIGHDRPLAPTESTLVALHRAHTAAIPFENLDILLGRGVSLDMDDIQDKLVRQERGGYCFEQNLLFSAVLEHAGFEVQRLVARVNPDNGGPRTHMTLNVSDGVRTWLADVGFGATLLEPIPMIDGGIARQGKWTVSVKRHEDGTWRLRSAERDGWSDLYAFTDDPQLPQDYRVYNHFAATHPRSPFVNQVVAIRITPEVRYTLRDRTLVTGRPGGASVERPVPDNELASTLRDTFGIRLSANEIATLLDPPAARPARS